MFYRDYLFQKPYWAVAQSLIDAAGSVLMLPFKAAGVPAEVKKILVSRIDHLGDVFIACSVLPHLKGAYPRAEIHFMAGEWAKDFLELNPFVDRIIVHNAFTHNRGRGTLKKALAALSCAVKNIRTLRRERYDICLDLRTYPCNSIPLLYLGGSRFKAGFATGGFGFLLDRVVPFRKGVHETAHMRDALKSLGIEAGENDIRPQFIPSKAALAEAARLLEKSGAGEKDCFVLIHTGSGNPKKLWKKEEWQAVASAFSRGGVKVAAFDAEHGLNDCIRLPGQMTFEVFAAVVQKASLFIGLDSLPAHLAASMGTPVVAVWCGINDPVRWRPVGPRVSIVKKDIGCAPCHRKNGCPSMACMEISAGRCIDEASKALGRPLAASCVQ